MLSDNIRTIRKNRGFTQEELAARLHVTRQTVSKWEKGYSVPDAELLSRMAEVFEVPVAELLGAPSASPADMEPIVEQLSRLNEQLAVKNRRAARIWRVVGLVLGSLALLYVLAAVLGMAVYTRGQPDAAGSVSWICTVDGKPRGCGLEYTKNYRVVAGSSDTVIDEGVGLLDYSDAREAQAALYAWVEAQGGTVEVAEQTGIPLPEP